MKNEERIGLMNGVKGHGVKNLLVLKSWIECNWWGKCRWNCINLYLEKCFVEVNSFGKI